VRVPETATACWLDGKRLPMERVRLGIDDPTVLAGLGLFETLAVHTGRVLELDLHLARLRDGASRLRLACPETVRLRDMLLDATAELSFEHGWLKLILTGLGSCIVFGGQLERVEEPTGATAVLLPWRRNFRDPLVGLKTLTGTWPRVARPTSSLCRDASSSRLGKGRGSCPGSCVHWCCAPPGGSGSPRTRASCACAACGKPGRPF